MKNLVLLAMMTFAQVSLAATTTLRQVDNIQATGGSLLAVPTVGTVVSSDTNTETLQNKSISGASNTITAISAGSISSGQISVANGGTGASTLTTNGMLFGNGTSAVGSTAAGSQYQTFQAGASGVPTVGALHLDQAAAITGILPVGNGGTGVNSLTSGSVVVGNGSSPVSLVAPGTSGNVLTSNGSTWVSSAASQAAPSLNGSQASPQSVTAGSGVALSSISYSNFAFIVSNSGAVTVTATPSITACTAAGQLTYLVGESASNTVTLQDEAGLTGSKLRLNGNWTSGLNKMLTVACDGNGFWVEVSRQN